MEEWTYRPNNDCEGIIFTNPNFEESAEEPTWLKDLNERIDAAMEKRDCYMIVFEIGNGNLFIPNTVLGINTSCFYNFDDAVKNCYEDAAAKHCGLEPDWTDIDGDGVTHFAKFHCIPDEGYEEQFSEHIEELRPYTSDMSYKHCYYCIIKGSVE